MIPAELNSPDIGNDTGFAFYVGSDGDLDNYGWNVSNSSYGQIKNTLRVSIIRMMCTLYTWTVVPIMTTAIQIMIPAGILSGYWLC